MGNRLTSAQIERIVELREQGKFSHRIAQILGIPAATINYQLLRAGLDPWDPTRRPRSDNSPSRFTPEEDTKLLSLRKDGMPIARIARAMSRPITSVRIRLLTLEVRDEAALEGATI